MLALTAPQNPTYNPASQRPDQPQQHARVNATHIAAAHAIRHETQAGRCRSERGEATAEKESKPNNSTGPASEEAGGGRKMGEVAALRQLVGQVQELWDLYGANAHPLLPRQAPHFLPPLPRLRLLPRASPGSVPCRIVSRELASALVLICRPLLSAREEQ
jgi:hypothetical protein